jgi:hypothetical protein
MPPGLSSDVTTVLPSGAFSVVAKKVLTTTTLQKSQASCIKMPRYMYPIVAGNCLTTDVDSDSISDANGIRRFTKYNQSAVMACRKICTELRNNRT